LRIAKIAIICSFILPTFLVGHFAQTEAPIIDYFWPLTVGKTFVYEMDKGEVVRSLLIKEVSRKDSSINVKIEENIKGYDFPVSFVEEYRVDLKQNIIFRNRGVVDKEIYLKGPIKVGTEWSTTIKEIRATISKERGETTERIAKEGKCRIDKFYDDFILDKKRACIEINCYDLRATTTLTKSYFCEGIGYVGMKSIVSGEWLERVKKRD
jgi:hypothetical protein